MAQASRIAKRALNSVTGGVAAYGVYKAKYDPPHIVWDLDETLLHSACPIEQALSTEAYPSDPDRYFDQIDDDFPYEKGVANTRTYWRPGAHQALQFCRLLSHQHVFTTAQGSYTENIMRELDPNRTIFDEVVHRGMFPESVKNGMQCCLMTSSKISDRRTERMESLHQSIQTLDKMIHEKCKRLPAWSAFLYWRCWRRMLEMLSRFCVPKSTRSGLRSSIHILSKHLTNMVLSYGILFSPSFIYQRVQWFRPFSSQVNL
jgi:hypothetical protein